LCCIDGALRDVGLGGIERNIALEHSLSFLQFHLSLTNRKRLVAIIKL
jgi:hypothetical protein